jgi:hypothetical protein
MLYLFIFCLDQYLFFQHQIEKLIIKLTSNIEEEYFINESTIDDILEKKEKKCFYSLNVAPK